MPIQNLKATLLCALSALGAMLATGSDAHADNVVLDIQEQDIYIDMGHDQGVVVGSTLTLEHVISAVHPITKESVRDTFPLGPMQVVNAGPTTCIARVDEQLFARVRIGDEVSLASKAVTFVDPWLTPRSRRHVDAGTSADLDWKQGVLAAKERIALEEEIRALWHSTLGQPLEVRLSRWQTFLTDNPDSPFADVVYRNAVEVEERIRTEAEMAALTPKEQRANAALRQLSILSGTSYPAGSLAQEAPTRGYAGEAIALALLVPDPDQIESAWLYYRKRGEGSYERAAMVVDGDSYLRGSIPGQAARAPGMDYFIEIVERDGLEPLPAVGSAQEPKRVAVDASVEEEAPSLSGHSRVTLFLDYVDFDGPSKSYDEYVHAEIDFMYRFFQPIYSLRLGFGTMSGKGGPKDVIDLDQDCTINGQYRCHRVGYNYAFAEIEERFTDLFAVMLRVQWGSVYRDSTPMEGADREFFDAFGARARIRLGREMESNLVLGASQTQRLGQMYEGAFTWDVIPKFPVVLAVQVTDQPVLEDFGVRLISDVGWRHFSWVYPSIRIAYQARDIDHAGLSAGLAANFDW